MTVGQLINYIASARSASPDSVTTLCRYPSWSEIQLEAFRQLQRAIQSVGGTVPEKLETLRSPDELIPRPQRKRIWREISVLLHCELPMLLPHPMRFKIVFLAAFAIMIGAWVALLYTFGFDKDPTTALGWLAEATFFLVMFAVSFFISAGAAELTTRRHIIPFGSVFEFVDHVCHSGEAAIEASLRVKIEATIHDFVVDVVSEELKLPREKIRLDTSLERIDAKPKAA